MRRIYERAECTFIVLSGYDLHFDRSFSRLGNSMLTRCILVLVQTLQETLTRPLQALEELKSGNTL